MHSLYGMVIQNMSVGSGDQSLHIVVKCVKRLIKLILHFQLCEKSVGTIKLHYSANKRYHVLDILKRFSSSNTDQSMKHRIATKR